MEILSYKLSWPSKLVLSIVVVKTLLTLVFVPWLIAHLGSNYAAGNFNDGYNLIAANVIEGNGYRYYPDTSLTMIRSPGFVLILAGIFWVFGENIFAVQVIQLFMSFATALIVYYLTHRLFNSKSISVFASLLFLFHPAVLIAESRGGVDITLMLCYTGCIALSYFTLKNPSLRNFVILGILFGWTALVKSIVVTVFPALVAVFLWFRPKGISVISLLLRFSLAGLVSLTVMSPWIIRNYVISGHFVPTMTLSGLALFQGAYLAKNLESEKDSYVLLNEASAKQIQIAHEMNLKTREGFFPQFYTTEDEIKYYNELGRIAVKTYLDSPVLFLKAVAHNAWAFWFQGRTKNATILNFFPTTCMLILMAWGGVLAVKITRDTWLLIIAILVFIPPYLVYLGVARYYLPLVPIISILAAVSVNHCRQLIIGSQYHHFSDKLGHSLES